VSFDKPMFFMARAVAPMLPGCEVFTSTMRMWLKALWEFDCSDKGIPLPCTGGNKNWPGL
jgi:hypothetical protein